MNNKLENAKRIFEHPGLISKYEPKCNIDGSYEYVQGSSTIVFKISDRQTKIFYAIKVIDVRNNLKNTKSSVRQISLTKDILLHYKGFVKCVDYYFHQMDNLGRKIERIDLVGIVMEYYEHDMFTFLRDNPISFYQGKILIVDILRSLKHLQTKGIVHRDVKPENFLVYKDGSYYRAKLGGFGKAREINGLINLKNKEAEILKTIDEKYFLLDIETINIQGIDDKSQEKDQSSIKKFQLKAPSAPIRNSLRRNLSGLVTTQSYTSPEMLLQLDYDTKVDSFGCGLVLFEIYFKMLQNHHCRLSTAPRPKELKIFNGKETILEVKDYFKSHVMLNSIVNKLGPIPLLLLSNCDENVKKVIKENYSTQKGNGFYVDLPTRMFPRVVDSIIDFPEKKNVTVINEKMVNLGLDNSKKQKSNQENSSSVNRKGTIDEEITIGESQDNVSNGSNNSINTEEITQIADIKELSNVKDISEEIVNKNSNDNEISREDARYNKIPLDVINEAEAKFAELLIQNNRKQERKEEIINYEELYERTEPTGASFMNANIETASSKPNIFESLVPNVLVPYSRREESEDLNDNKYNKLYKDSEYIFDDDEAVDLKFDYWSQIHHQLQILLLSLLRLNPQDRISVSEALNCPWLSLPEKPDEQDKYEKFKVSYAFEEKANSSLRYWQETLVQCIYDRELITLDLRKDYFNYLNSDEEKYGQLFF